MSSPDRLDEKSRRRLDFLPDSLGLTLADGQEWYVPRPRVAFVYSDNDLGFDRVSETGDVAFDRTLQDRIDAWRKAAEADDVPGVIGAQLGIARVLLLRNYDLDTDELRALVRFRFEGDDTLRDDILAIAMGQPLTPKPTPAGDSSA